MTISPAITTAVDLPAGLTLEDALGIAAAIEASHAPKTRALYATHRRLWQRWCAARGIDPLPAPPEALAAYLVERAAGGVTIGTVNGICVALRHVHHQHGLANPAETEIVRNVRLGLRRIYGRAPKRLARPLTVPEIRQIVDAIDRATLAGARDAAIILLGYASAMRGGELTDLTIDDVAFKPAGLLITIRQSKTDQAGEGQIVAVAHGQHAATDPVAALNAWLSLRGDHDGPLFSRIFKTRVGDQHFCRIAVLNIVRQRAINAGLDGTRITAHSLRAGHATTAALAGVPLTRIAAQTRHKDLGVLVNRYIRPLEALASTSSRDLGL